ncbi:MAG: Fe(3+) ABC transporter substrate-binding protein [Candidatus Competibacterales bacterium]
MFERFIPMALLFALAVAPTVWAQGEMVNVYNSRHYGTDKELYAAFTEATGIEVNVVEGKHDELIQRLANEGENTQADLLITVDAGRLSLAATKDLLQGVETETLQGAVPEHLRHPEGLWYGISMRARVLVYDKEDIDPSDLSTYEALADDQYEGQVLSRSSNNVYTQSLVASILAANGPEQTEAWAVGVVENFARPPQGGDTDQIRAVAAGQGDVAISNTYYVARLLNSDQAEDRQVGEQVGVFFPNQDDRGTHVNISGAGVTRYAPNRDNAVELLEYLVTEGQRYFADVNFEYPVNPEFEPHPTLQTFGDFKQDTLNASVYGENSAEAVMIMDRAGWK